MVRIPYTFGSGVNTHAHEIRKKTMAAYMAIRRLLRSQIPTTAALLNISVSAPSYYSLMASAGAVTIQWQGQVNMIYICEVLIGYIRMSVFSNRVSDKRLHSPSFTRSSRIAKEILRLFMYAAKHDISTGCVFEIHLIWFDLIQTGFVW